MRAAAFLAVGGSFHRDHRLAHQIVEFERFDQIGIPDQRAISDADIGKLGVDLVHRRDAFVEQDIVAEHSSMRLHRFLHFEAQVGGRDWSLGIAEMVEALQRQIGGVRRQRLVRRVRHQLFLEPQTGCAAKDHEIDQRV